MKISVCMATYNGEKYIKEQLDSILSQIDENDEIIITDDISNDKTVQIIKSFEDNRIKIYVNKEKLGATANFNESLSKASGDVIFLSDQDDIWLNNKVSICLKNLEIYDLIVTNCKVADENLNISHNSYFNLVHSGKGLVKNLYKSTYLGCCLAFNRNILNAILPIPNNLMMYHDWWIGFVAEQKFKVYFERKPLLLYRRHGNTTSSTVGKSKNSLFFKIKSRLQLLTLGLERLKDLKNDI
ncbi:glycosyltransferase family 2 protein [Aliarcobacter butzleri]|uniref:glycosyltransferase family 2 protein n=1 Tax=Aliarcobacter butzleri TaxID=28197 RepID=UPI0021B3FE8E|nr:glycosyltransferase family 2 protein [Aliarcobacter butzleri]MCT7635635.1 glycosyltransferase family 2 protein [Aliarcobacter butzleri]